MLSLSIILGLLREIGASPVTWGIASRPRPKKSASKKGASKLFILQGAVPATFFRPRLAHTQSIAFRDLALCMLKESLSHRITNLSGETAPPRRTSEMRRRAGWGVSSGPRWYVDCPVFRLIPYMLRRLGCLFDLAQASVGLPFPPRAPENSEFGAALPGRCGLIPIIRLPGGILSYGVVTSQPQDIPVKPSSRLILTYDFGLALWR